MRAEPLSPASSPARWLHPGQADPEATARLFLLHHSGGNATAYRRWRSLLPGDITAQCVQLPGRQERRAERPYTRLEPLVGALADVLHAELDDRPYALFGHSMGAMLAYRVTVELARREATGPVLVAASGWAPPGFAGQGGAPGRRDGAAPAGRAHGLGALPAELRDDQDLLADAVRVLRADTAACAGYRDDHAVIGSPIVAYSGRDDPLVAPEAMRSWAARTTHFLGDRQYPGGHFFLQGHAVDIATDLVGLLRRLGAGSRHTEGAPA